MADWMMSSEQEDLMSGDEEDQLFQEVVPVVSPRQTIIKLITEGSLLPAQREELLKVMEILSVKEQHARILLIHYRWDLQKLLDAFVERGAECLFSEAGVAITMESRNRVVTTCIVCREEDLQEVDTTTMDCGHTFCNVCWTEQFLTKINEGQSKLIKCMDPECNVICDEDIVRKLVSAKDPEAAQRFDRFLFQSYIDDNSKVKWCPSVPSCGNAASVEEDVYCEIQCVCGHQFCFNCLAEAHSPCSCLIWDLWEEKYLEESGNSNWIAVNTMLCPKCGTNVEKDGGCNLMTCVCGQHFCWLCGGATGNNHVHTCGRYKEEHEETDIEKAQRDLKRYKHYYSRWKAHQNSLQLETKQRQLWEENILYLESKESDLIGSKYRWLKDALQRLFRSRRALAYSYPFAFHMFGDDILKDQLTTTEKELKQNLFEHQQQQLERTVESLSRMIERPFDEQSVMANKMQIIHLSLLADTRCSKMYECAQTDLVRNLGLIAHQITPYNNMGFHILSET